MPPAGIDPRQMARMMRSMGIDVRDIGPVDEVVVRTASRDYVFRKPQVSIMKAQGQETWQVVGTPSTVERPSKSAAAAAPAAGVAPAAARPAVSAAPRAALDIPAEDVEMVASQTGCTKAAALAALQACDGDLAKAILHLS
ncbi:MAG: nascent polypeptide-associated complex protein [Thermoplasmatota archaeon]